MFSNFEPGATSLGNLLVPIVTKLPKNTSLSALRYDLNAGVPDSGSLPAEQLAASAVDVLRNDPAGALTYGGQQGYEPLRAWIAKSEGMKAGLSLGSDTVSITSGSAHGLENIALTFVAEGDPVIVGAPTYPGAIRTFRARGAKLISVRQDDNGIDPGELATVLKALTAGGTPAKLIYLSLIHI